MGWDAEDQQKQGAFSTASLGFEMNLITKVIIVLIVGTISILMPWLLIFGGYDISSSPANWGVFGDYVGGTLATFISILALIALLYNLKHQQNQIDIIFKDFQKNDILVAIDRLEADFEKCLKRHPVRFVMSDNEVIEVTGSDVLFNLTFVNYKNILITKEQITDIGEIQANDIRVSLFEMFATAAGELNQIRIYSEQLEIISGNNLLSRYYQRKYKTPYQRLSESGYLVTKWN